MREHGVFILMAAAAVLGALVFVYQRRALSPPRGEQSTGPSASGSASSEPARAPMGASADRARNLQRSYWTPNPQEKSRLLARGVAALRWNEKLRLLHLTCLDELSTDASRRMLEDEDIDPEGMPAGPNRELVETLVAELRSAVSPFRPRHAVIWKGKGGESEEREPDVEGVFENASLTHLGALEVVRLDAQQQPTELVFVPLDDLRGVVLASPAIFRLAKLEGKAMSDDVKCTECGDTMVSTREDRPYSKLPGVLLVGVEVRRCPKCGESEIVIPRPNQLGELLAKHLIEKRDRLVGPEIRFLRAHLGLAGTELARRMGVSPETVSRWENGKDTMGPVADRLLRLLVAGDMPGEALAAIGDDPKPLSLVVRASRTGWKEAA